ncbi:MAG: acetyl-CoA carboxylase biotin carboxyl carrier protein [Myxococcales bacterium]|nr:acetyl-CoA carboxylase biotin carboxyl carrier protein [Myxococcales bacterium]
MPPDSRDLTSLPDLRYIRKLAEVFKQYELGEVEIETGDSRILLRRSVDGVAVVSAPAAVAPSASSPVVAVAPSRESATATRPEETGEFITSPFVGTFYRSPNPDAPVFVDVGDRVVAGQTLCIVEAMKLFNEIEAEYPCVIEEVLVESAQPVEYGAKLFRVRRS